MNEIVMIHSTAPAKHSLALLGIAVAAEFYK